MGSTAVLRRRAVLSLVAIAGILATSLTVFVGSSSNDAAARYQERLLDSSAQRCSTETGTSHDYWCTTLSVLRTAELHGAAQAEAELARLETSPDCHETAHTLGSWLYFESGFEGIGSRDPGCGYGLLHGAFQAWAESTPRSEILADVSAPCSPYRDGNDDRALRMCLHGVGHALSLSGAQAGLDWFEAIEPCSSSHGIVSEAAELSCITGGILQYSDRSVPVALAEARSSLAMCRNYGNEVLDKQKVSAVCVTYMSSLLGVDSLTAMASSFAVCAELGLGDECPRGLGNKLANGHLSADLVVAYCETASDGLAAALCLDQAALSTAVAVHDMTVGQDVCRAATPALAPACFASLEADRQEITATD